MTTFFNSPSSYKPQVRQEGFHLPSPDANPPSPPDSNPPHSSSSPHPHNQSYDPYAGMPHNFLPDAFRNKSGSGSGMDFTDELASLMGESHERSTHDSAYDAHDHHNPNTTSYRNEDHYRDDTAYRPPHNIFDISAPSTHHSHRAHQHQQFSLPSHSSTLPPHDYNLNSTLPALNSSMRYDPHPAPASPLNPNSNPINLGNAPPSSYTYTSTSRSRSRSRSSGAGPTRNARRRVSVSSTSPPPGVHHQRPSAIVIPGGRGGDYPGGRGSPYQSANNNGRGSPYTGAPGPGGWFIPSNAPPDFPALPTPESITHPSFHQSYPNGAAAGGTSYPNGGMGVSPSEVSVSSLASPHPSSLPHASSMARAASSLPNGNAGKGAAGAKGTADIASEKRRRRRESHNAVERRRRDNINEKIGELAGLIPECMLDAGASGTTPTDTTPDPLTGLPLLPAPSGDVAKKEEDGSANGAEGSTNGSTGTPGHGGTGAGAAEGGGLKANKGMILRKSVEYIRYLQQLVSAQATRNRELEAQLALTSSSSPPSNANNANGAAQDGEMGLMLHEEAGFMGFGEFGNGNERKFSGFGELASMPEDMEMEMDGNADRKPVEGLGDGEERGAGKGEDEPSPASIDAAESATDGDGDREGENEGEADGEEEERGRGRGRERGRRGVEESDTDGRMEVET
ncbi:hypothetical protein PLICRDRAFT_123029 [Plicaturopsis crispa FD-325 SS-3]|nr:hypothetical protein PLICRDRAFT_123029 [Plicaturopsis crispa FD-325 SS-3]